MTAHGGLLRFHAYSFRLRRNHPRQSRRRVMRSLPLPNPLWCVASRARIHNYSWGFPSLLCRCNFDNEADAKNEPQDANRAEGPRWIRVASGRCGGVAAATVRAWSHLTLQRADIAHNDENDGYQYDDNAYYRSHSLCCIYRASCLGKNRQIIHSKYYSDGILFLASSNILRCENRRLSFMENVDACTCSFPDCLDSRT